MSTPARPRRRVRAYPPSRRWLIGGPLPQDDRLVDGLEDLWAESTGEPEVCVALLDGPVDLAHDALRDADIIQLGDARTPARGGVALRHGTHVASVIFGQHEGPVRGIAPCCRGLALPLFHDDGNGQAPGCTQAELAAAIDTAREAGAQIINVSAGDVSPAGAADPALVASIEACAERGVLVVAATGAHGCRRPQVPGSLDPVLAVASSDGGGERRADVPGCLHAPGEGIAGALAGGGVAVASGSSYATAVTSGVAALLLGLPPRRAAALDVGRVLLDSAGPGRVLDVPAAVALLRECGPGAHEDRPAAGDYAVSPVALREKFRGVAAEDFGTVRVRAPRSRAFLRVPDFHYPLEDGGSGMRLLPDTELDAHLRREMGLAEDDPVFAILSYIHPEDHSYELELLPRTAKIQLGHRHVGSYLGDGRTTQVLSDYARWRGSGPTDMELNVDRHPANVQVLALRDTPQAVLNRNAHIVDTLITAAAKVPKDADNITDCRTVDLTTTLQYYRDLIRDEAYLEDLAWYTQCAVHKTIVVNVLLNVPHNVAAFTEIFGAEGDELWSDFRRGYEQLSGEPFTPSLETDFTPLWRLAGLSAESVRPLTLAEYNRYHAAREQDDLERHRGRRPLPTNGGLAWPLETLVDLLAGFITTYVPFKFVGGVGVSAQLLLLAPVLHVRARLDESACLDAVTPIVATLLAAEAATKGPFGRRWLDTADREVFWAARGGWPYPDAERLRAATQRCAAAARGLTWPAASAGVDARAAAAAWATEAVRPELDRLRELVAEPGGRSGWFAGPSLFHRLALGQHPRSDLVDIRTVATVMDHGDLVVRPAAEALQHDRGGYG